MRWQGRRGSGNVEDRRGVGGRGVAIGGVGGGLGLIILLVVMFLGGDPGSILGGSSDQSASSGLTQEQQDQQSQFASVVLADTEEVWGRQFQEQLNRTYEEPTMVLFTDYVQSACGGASSQVGPFYCPADRKVYIDLSFFDELSSRYGASGDFAAAYVLAHEVGHHVQNLVGISDAVSSRQQQVSQVEANRLSMRLELQADFLAGVWAHYAQETLNVVEPGDIDEALRAAGAIGDDTLQKQAQGYAVPDSFTHGTSAQRAKWFRLGFETGDVSKGDTFGTPWGDL